MMRAFAQKPKARQQAAAKPAKVSRAPLAQRQEIHSIFHSRPAVSNQAMLRRLKANSRYFEPEANATASARAANSLSLVPAYPASNHRIQAKLKVSEHDDIHEREADRVADEVMRIPEPSVQRKCACGGGCPRCTNDSASNKQAVVRRSKETGDSDAVVPPFVNDVLRSNGQPLEPNIRKLMETRFGYNFGKIRIHKDRNANESARILDAKAYTVENNIFFAHGMYRPETLGGHTLLAHELAHCIQQSHSSNFAREFGSHNDLNEQEATQAASALGWGILSPHYGDVALDKTLHGANRQLPSLPKLSAASAWVQRLQLTYDDGPDSAGNTRAILKSLNEAGARATFYLVGKRIETGDNWRVVFDIAAAGHWLGNHAFDWDNANDNHIFLRGTAEERAQKILETEWAIRDALIRGRDEALRDSTWNAIPAANRSYIEDVIAHGTGRFRTPGFRSKTFDPRLDDPWTGTTTLGEISSVNQVLAASGLRPLAVTNVSGLTGTHEGVNVDPEDWQAGRTSPQIQSAVSSELSSNADSILLHSRIGATAAATPAIVSDVLHRGFSFDATPQGTLGSVQPRPGFAGLSQISSPPTSSEMAQARAFLQHNKLSLGPFVSGAVAIGIFQLAQLAGSGEVDKFIAEIRATKIATPTGPVPMANWMNAYPEWRLFASFYENWRTKRRFPRIKGLTF